MTIFLLKAFCVFLLSIGVAFIFLELRCRFERLFLYFGLLTVLLCLFGAIDLWALPDADSLASKLYWLRIQHVLALFTLPVLCSFVFTLTDTWSKFRIQLIILFSSILSVFFLSDLMLSTSPSGGEESRVVAGPLYYLVFIPVFFISIIGLNILIMLRINTAEGKQRKILQNFLIGSFTLCFFGCLDMFSLVQVISLPIPNFTIIGILSFSTITAFFFTEQFTGIIRENKVNYGKLQAAYKDLEQASTLKELGQSTSIINHEIKNYLFVISGNMYLLNRSESLSEKGQTYVSNITQTVEHLTEFCQDVLNLSKAEIIKEKRRISLGQMVSSAIEKHFALRRDWFELEGTERDVCIYGDWDKLDHVFLNIFKNAFEAQAQHIKIKQVRGKYVVCLVIEDDGVGCSQANLMDMFKAFHSTKKGNTGTGLGLSFSRAIIEAHGGHISAYSKNCLQNGSRGLIMNIIFPLYETAEDPLGEQKQNIVLIKERIEDIGTVLRLFKNVNCNPHIVQGIADLRKMRLPQDQLTILADATNAAEIEKRFPGEYAQVGFLKKYDNTIYISTGDVGATPSIFCEEFILSQYTFHPCPLQTA